MNGSLRRVGILFAVTVLLTSTGCLRWVFTDPAVVNARVVDNRSGAIIPGADVCLVQRLGKAYTFNDSIDASAQWGEETEHKTRTNAYGVFRVKYRYPTFYIGYVPGPIVRGFRIAAPGYATKVVPESELEKAKRESIRVSIFRSMNLPTIRLDPEESKEAE